MLDYLVTSRARKDLLRLVWGEGQRGSVSELARLAGLSFRSAHRELNEMAVAGLARVSHVGNATVFEAADDHPRSQTLRLLLEDRPRADGAAARRRGREVRSWLRAWGAPLATSPMKGKPPPLERALAHGVRLARSDETVARALPVCLWKNRKDLDGPRLMVEAQRLGQKHATGFFLELTGRIANAPTFRRVAEHFRDHRRRRPRDFFTGPKSPEARQRVEEHTPDVARRWAFRMHLPLEAFTSAFPKTSTNPGAGR